MQASQDRPPYVSFERREEEDRNATIEAGHYVARDVDIAVITPMGSKDRIERKVSELFPQWELAVREGRFAAEWLAGFKAAYKAWQGGNEMPVNGTAIELWPVASPAQVKMLRNWAVRTVEDLANANEETIVRLGMGGRSLKQRAVEWLVASKNIGMKSEEVAALRAENADLKARNASLDERLAALEKVMAASKPAPAK